MRFRLPAFTIDRRTFAALVAVIAVLLVLRRPDALLHAQFWAEDGAVWYADAHNAGWLRAIAMPQDGYFSTYLRLLGAAAQALPLIAAPLFFAVVALALQLLPAAVFLSERYRGVAPDGVRGLIALLYALLPNTAEVHANATNAQWYLALLAFTVLLARSSTSRAWIAFDVSILLLSGISGPYALFLLPIALVLWRKERSGRRRLQCALLAACGALQLWSLFVLHVGYRTNTLPAVDIPVLVSMLVKQIVLGGLVGMRIYGYVAEVIPRNGLAVAATAAIALALAVHAALRGPAALRAFIFFAAAAFAASLAAPNLGAAANTSPYYRANAWAWMTQSSSGSRYWLLPIIAWTLILVWNAGRRHQIIVRAVAIVFLLMLPLGILGDYTHRPYEDMHFSDGVRAYDAASPGATIELPLNPRGWSMHLIKK